MGFGRGLGLGWGYGYGRGLGQGSGAFSGYSCVKFVFFGFNVIFWVSHNFKKYLLIFCNSSNNNDDGGTVPWGLRMQRC